MVMSSLKAIVTYVAIAFGSALLVDLALLTISTTKTLLIHIIWGFLRMYTPTLASLITLRLEGYRFREALSFTGVTTGASLKIIKWFLLAPLIPFSALALYIAIACAIGTFTINPLVRLLEGSPIPLNPAIYALVLLFSSYIAAITVNAGAALGEEIGWRGFLARKLKDIGFVRECLIIGVLWGLWHASAILLLGHNYRVHRVEGVLLFTIFTTVLTVPMVLIRDITDNVFPAASLHGSLNAIWGLTYLLSDFPNNELYDGLGILGIITWSIIAIISVFLDKTRQRKGKK